MRTRALLVVAIEHVRRLLHFGTPLGDDTTFPHVLAVALGCRVANFGMPGYGSDQAFLLYRAQRDVDAAPLTVTAPPADGAVQRAARGRGRQTWEQ